MHELLQRAREALAIHQPETAVEFYLRGLTDTDPIHRSIYENEFLNALELWRENCDHQEYSNAIMRACSLLPANMSLANMCGKFFASTGYFHQALYFYSLAKESTDWKTRIRAIACIESVKHAIMPLWHWSMVNDERRNFCFDNALMLAQQKKPFGRVLDVGTGTGILTAFAKRYFRTVYSCEVLEFMCEIARHVTHQYIINKHSCLVDLADLGGQKVDVLVTETIAPDVLSEGIIDIVHHAYNQLLNDNAIIIPYGVVVYGCLVESQAIADISHLTIGSQQFVASFVLPPYLYREGRDTEPVEHHSQHIYSLKGGYRILSKSELYRIDFNSYQEVQQIFNDGFTRTVSAQVLHDGTAHAIVTWFRCVVYPNSEPIISGPGSHSCWEQAVYPLPVPVPVEAGNRCGLMTQVKRCAVLNSFIGIIPHKPNESPPEMILLNEMYTKRTFLSYLTTLEKVNVLPNNDSLLLQFFEAALEAERSHLKNYILDLAMIPKMTYRLAQRFSKQVFYSAQDELDKLTKAFVDVKNCHLVASDSVIEMVCDKNSSAFDLKKVDALLCWPIDYCGHLRDECINKICALRMKLALLDYKVIVIPSKIIIRAQLIHSFELKRELVMNRQAFRGVNMDILHSYCRQHHFDIEVSKTKYQKLSESFDLMPIELNEELDLDSQTLPQLMCYHTCQSELVATKAGNADGLLYWFEARHMDQSYSTKSTDGNHRCAFYLFKKTRMIGVGEHLKFKSTLYHSILTIDDLLEDESHHSI